jgi:hypothetical protein
VNGQTIAADEDLASFAIKAHGPSRVVGNLTLAGNRPFHVIRNYFE